MNNNKNNLTDSGTPIQLTKADLPMVFNMSANYRQTALLSIVGSLIICAAMIGVMVHTWMADPVLALAHSDVICGGSGASRTLHDDKWMGQAINGVAAIFWFAMSIWMIRAYREMGSKSVTLCAEGLYITKQLPDAPFIRWDEIQAIEDRPLLQRMDLCGEKGRRLISLHYQLDDFNRIIGFVTKNVSLTNLIDIDWPIEGNPASMRSAASSSAPAKTFRKNWAYNVFVFGFMAGAALAGMFWPNDFSWFAVVGGFFLAAIVGHEYKLTVQSLTIWRDHLEVKYPFNPVNLTREDIKDVRLSSSGTANGQYCTEIVLDLTVGRMPIAIRGLHKNPADLAATIRRWWAAKNPPLSAMLSD